MRRVRERKGDASVGLQLAYLRLRHRGDGYSYLLHQRAELFAQHLEVTLHLLHQNALSTLHEVDFLHVHLVHDERAHGFQTGLHLSRSGNHQLLKRLLDDDVYLLAQGKTHRRHLLRQLHAKLQLAVDNALVGFGEAGEVYATHIVASRDANEVGIELVSIERSDGSHQAGDGFQTDVERLVSSQLIFGIACAPETLAAEANVPVAEVIGNEVADEASRLRRLVVGIAGIDATNERVEFAQYPAVNLGTLADGHLLFGIAETVEVGVGGKEFIGVVERAEELTDDVRDALLVELQVVPRAGVGNHVPPDGIGAVLADGAEGIDGIAQSLRHLGAVLVKHQAVADDGLVGNGMLHHRADGMEGEEPSARLVDALGDEVGGIDGAAIDEFLVLEGIVHLGEGHSAAVEPHVDEVRLALHGLTRR